VSDLLQRIGNNLPDRRLLKRGQPLLVAVSGGLDSMALLHLLHTLAARHRWKLAVAHFNHRLRGRSSDADEKLVRKTAAGMGLPVVVERADVRRFAIKSKLSIEMAARKLRHEFFARAAKKRGLRTVALAHHADDQVELFFLRLLRGAGGEGLAGMKWRAPSPVDGKITLVRPLLGVTRAELREFARENKIRFREDATNALLAAPRNRIRNELLPLLRERYQPGLAKTVLRLMEIVGAEADVVGEMALHWLKEAGGDGPPGRPRTPRRGVPTFADLPVAVQRRVLQWQLESSGVLVDFELVERLRRSPDVFVSVSPHCSVARDAAGLVKLQTQPPAGFNVNELTVNLADRAGEADFSGVQIRWNFHSRIAVGRGCRRAGSRGRSPHQTEYFDAGKVGGRIKLRHWRPGDRFQPIGMKAALKLQDWFVNQGIPRLRRRQLVVAAVETGGIFWIEGLRIGENFKLTPQTKRRLIWRWQRVETKSNR
jgi:tRNA(Ile)-lysidine synthase